MVDFSALNLSHKQPTILMTIFGYIPTPLVTRGGVTECTLQEKGRELGRTAYPSKMTEPTVSHSVNTQVMQSHENSDSDKSQQTEYSLLQVNGAWNRQIGGQTQKEGRLSAAKM